MPSIKSSQWKIWVVSFFNSGYTKTQWHEYYKAIQMGKIEYYFAPIWKINISKNKNSTLSTLPTSHMSSLQLGEENYYSISYFLLFL